MSMNVTWCGTHVEGRFPSLFNRISDSFLLIYVLSGEVQNFAGIHTSGPADLEEEKTEGKTILRIHERF